MPIWTNSAAFHHLRCTTATTSLTIESAFQVLSGFSNRSHTIDLKSAALLNTTVQKLQPNMKESWLLLTVKKHWVKPTLLDFNDWLKKKAEAHDLMKNTTFKARTEDTNNSVTRSKVASKAFAANTQHKSSVKPQQSCPSPPISSCIVCKGSHRLWEFRVFKEKTSRREPRLWLMQSSVSLVCGINICSGSAKIPVNVEKMVATAPLTPYFTELKGFFQLNPQQTTTSTIRSRTQVLVGHLPVNSNQAKQPLCLP